MLLGNIEIYECPLSQIGEVEWWLLDLWTSCHNFIPSEAGVGLQQWSWPYSPAVLMNQPLYIVDAFKVITSEWYKIQAEKTPKSPSQDKH